MRLIAMIGVVAASLFAANAYGEGAETNDQLRLQATDLIVRHCMASPMVSGLENSSEHCNCGAGVMVRDLNERQLTVFTRVFSHYPNREAGRAEAERMIAEEGYTREDIVEMGNLLSESDSIMAECPA
jgi:hypothetical protein